MSKRKPRQQQQRPWTPMERGEINPELVEHLRQTGDPVLPTESWTNDLYQVVVRHRPDGITHLSIKRHDRHPVTDWRHKQSIKNEVCGYERWGMELFPDERQLIDTSNEYHLFVLPDGVLPPATWGGGYAVLDADQINQGRAAGFHKARQRPWQPGLPTGMSLLEMLDVAPGYRKHVAEVLASDPLGAHLRGE